MGYKLLIVDDDPDIIKLIGDNLEKKGFEVIVASNGREAMDKFRIHHPDLVILDLMMPDKDGIAIFDTIKQLSTYTRIIVYTGYQEYEKSIYARSADRFIVKGSSIEQLVEAVDELS